MGLSLLVGAIIGATLTLASLVIYRSLPLRRHRHRQNDRLIAELYYGGIGGCTLGQLGLKPGTRRFSRLAELCRLGQVSHTLQGEEARYYLVELLPVGSRPR